MAELECFCYGAGHGDEGICLSLSIGPYFVLLDCGLTDIAPLLFSPLARQIDAVICSNAQGDHSRGIWNLQQQLRDLPIYASVVTSRLLSIQRLGEDGFPGTIALDWRSPTEICPGLTLQFWPAGHLPGAACALLSYDSSGERHSSSPRFKRRRQVLYTGDCMVSSSRLVDGMPLGELSGLKPDVLIIDGSYGISRSARRKKQESQLAEIVLGGIAQGRSIILPTPRLGLGQELLMLFRSHHHFTGKDVDIWVSPGIAAGCDAYLDLVDHFPSSVQNFARHQPLFLDDRVLPHVYRLENQNPETLAAIAQRTPSVFLVEAPITPSFFLNHSFKAQRNQWLILLSHHPNEDQYQTFLTHLHSAPQNHNIVVEEDLIQPVSYSLGSHCDGPVTMQVIHSIRPQHLIFVHGKPHFLLDLAGQEELQNRYQIHLPAQNKSIELPVGDRFIQPDPPSLNYRGELTALQTTILLTLDPSIQDDVRWQAFADTGLIKARWQGNDLLITGIPAPDVAQGSRQVPPFPIACCEYCAYYRNRRCWNDESSLFGLQVTPEGSCPVFKSI
ncbi:MAG: MBL fold metallo-hydrolase [Cyanobacteria bacterium P01_F01_bin.150]